MELKGSIIAVTDDTRVTSLVFTVGNAAGGAPINMTVGTDATLIIGYRDEAQVHSTMTFTVTFKGKNDGDSLLEQGELAEITLTDLAGALEPDLEASSLFALELKPAQGGVLVLERRTPDALDAIVDLQ